MLLIYALLLINISAVPVWTGGQLDISPDEVPQVVARQRFREEFGAHPSYEAVENGLAQQKRKLKKRKRLQDFGDDYQVDEELLRLMQKKFDKLGKEREKHLEDEDRPRSSPRRIPGRSPRSTSFSHMPRRTESMGSAPKYGSPDQKYKSGYRFKNSPKHGTGLEVGSPPRLGSSPKFSSSPNLGSSPKYGSSPNLGSSPHLGSSPNRNKGEHRRTHSIQSWTPDKHRSVRESKSMYSGLRLNPHDDPLWGETHGAHDDTD